MANTNTGAPLRLENGGIVRAIIDPDGTPVEHEFLLLEAGSVSIQEGLSERIPIMDRGAFTGDVLEGDERVSVINLANAMGRTTFDTFLALTTPASANGLITKFNLEIEWAPGKGSSTTEGMRFTRCYQPEGNNIQTGGAGQSKDQVSRVIHSLDAEATYYTPS